MVDSAQKAPIVAGVAITALNVAVVRQAVFKRAAQQIAEKADRTTQDIVEATKKNRAQAKALSDAATKTANDGHGNSGSGGTPAAPPVTPTSPAPSQAAASVTPNSNASGAKVDLKV